MARDCINFPVALAKDPRVIEIAKRLGVQSGAVLLGIAMTWGEAGNETPDDGVIHGDDALTRVDMVSRLPGFGHALLDAGLILAVEGGFEVVGYAEMHGQEGE